jgi:hypothetical protein
VEVNNILAVIDAEIEKLQQARALLAGAGTIVPKARRGRPKGSKNVKTAEATTTTKTTPRKRQLSPEGSKAIADAMKRRRAERRKLAAKQPAIK